MKSLFKFSIFLLISLSNSPLVGSQRDGAPITEQPDTIDCCCNDCKCTCQGTQRAVTCLFSPLLLPLAALAGCAYGCCTGTKEYSSHCARERLLCCPPSGPLCCPCSCGYVSACTGSDQAEFCTIGLIAYLRAEAGNNNFKADPSGRILEMTQAGCLGK